MENKRRKRQKKKAKYPDFLTVLVNFELEFSGLIAFQRYFRYTCYRLKLSKKFLLNPKKSSPFLSPLPPIFHFSEQLLIDPAPCQCNLISNLNKSFFKQIVNSIWCSHFDFSQVSILWLSKIKLAMLWIFHLYPCFQFQVFNQALNFWVFVIPLTLIKQLSKNK